MKVAISTILHKFDSPTNPEFKEVSQKEFEKGLHEFFSATKPKGDSLEEFEQRQGLKDIPVELMKHLLSEYGKQEKSSFV